MAAFLVTSDSAPLAQIYAAYDNLIVLAGSAVDALHLNTLPYEVADLDFIVTPPAPDKFGKARHSAIFGTYHVRVWNRTLLEFYEEVLQPEDKVIYAPFNLPIESQSHRVKILKKIVAACEDATLNVAHKKFCAKMDAVHDKLAQYAALGYQ